MPPCASRKGAYRGFGNFFATRQYKNSVSYVEAGMDGHGRTNHVHRTLHILDVISSVSTSSKCTKIIGGLGFASDPLGELQEGQRRGMEGYISSYISVEGDALRRIPHFKA